MAKIREDAGYVHVTDPESGERTVYGPGDTVKSEHEKIIRNKALFETAPDEKPQPVAGSAGQLPGDPAAAKARQAATERAKAQGGS